MMTSKERAAGIEHSTPYPAATFRGKPKRACIICGGVWIYPYQVERHYQRRHAEIIADRAARRGELA